MLGLGGVRFLFWFGAAVWGLGGLGFRVCFCFFFFYCCLGFRLFLNAGLGFRICFTMRFRV